MKVQNVIAARRHRLSLLLVVAATLFCLRSQAQKPPDVTAGEVARLPAYCAQSQSFAGGFPEGPLPGQKPWIAKMGHGFWAIHHYCWAMINANRAAAVVIQQTRGYLLSSAIKDCNYVIRSVPADFVLLPEIYLRMGEYYDRLGQPAAALEHFERSRQSKPDYWPAYVRLANLQAKLGNAPAAAKTLAAGLVLAPNQPELQTALDRLEHGISGSAAKRPSSVASGARQGPR